MSGNSSASDIITYVGVPLAVLGVAPILYNTVITLATLSKVRRLLRKSRLVGITRGDVVNHVIECELARFSIAPLSRQYDTEEYWNVYEHPSLVPGGSWTIFNWKMHAIGIKTQRIEYSDQLRQPQAEINFEDLLSYLLDLGAVPNAAGFQMLRTSGLWVPVGTPLMLSPDRHEAVLTIAPLDDSDGMLSLAVRWSRKWVVRGKTSLPPYWIQVKALREKASPIHEGSITEDGVSSITKSPADQEDPELAQATSGDLIPDDNKDLEAAKSHSNTVLHTDVVRCHITSSGITAALREKALDFEPLPITHLRPSSGSPTSAGIYFSCISTALSTTNNAVLWSYHIPPPFLAFSRSPIIPCGILVLLGMVPITSTPEWYTDYGDSGAEERDLQMRRMRDSMTAMRRESSMTPDQHAVAIRDRQFKQHQDFVDDSNQRRRLAVQREETRMLEALQSPQWKAQLVGEHTLLWLKEQNHVAVKAELPEVMEVVLHRMVTEPAFANDLAEVLDTWKGWVEGGGIRKADYLMLKKKLVVFAFASLVLAMVYGSVEPMDGSLSKDLQESIGIWKKVRLG
ncbi:hypothetical protein VC83_00078 [Pseudogymnoascus destructans]|uniref:Uncharacterized protein n=2 Tax=Pseudogymnoascus destructans TaxID=655981 RepID=L8G5I4_PSED2|nr:uncharacterized protein VC83_00078 [Pseudogymnoascus destructans]ELR07938.1 hypothetical protein GMDG_02797 [Pseudogymnoascus destructans 20631-21]OAF62965.1 hypothetical protein VC83_00078 [Pseudogymnoascus destructans]WQG15621.1 hypothetical protein VC83_00078 [Pseudogymnoascus destructans]